MVLTLRKASCGDTAATSDDMLEVSFHSRLLLFVIYPFSPKILYACSSLCFQRCLAGVPSALICGPFYLWNSVESSSVLQQMKFVS